ncbi:MAG: metallophosphoesterase [Bacteroidales bacterium]|jgi:predicted phosphodiesterase|nr:metallophosphoesterase [Bacteroidales bacterium]
MGSFRTYSFPDAKNIMVCGDIHGEFNAVIYKLCIQYQMTDTLLIVAGDCGFGFDKPGYYDNVFNRNSSRLSKSNNWVVMLRGNHDDPSYFRDEKISHERFRTIPDYCVIQACGRNILCVGGAVSIDRDYRKKHDSSHSVSDIASYWPDEIPIYDGALLEDIGNEIKIDTVITHTAPSFCELISKAGLSEWAAIDPDISSDCEKERKTMDRIFEHLMSAGHPVSHWYYGHFHQSWRSEIDGILFSMLDIMEFKEVPSAI